MGSTSGGIFKISRKFLELRKEISFGIFAKIQNIIFTFSPDVRQLKTK